MTDNVISLVHGNNPNEPYRELVETLEGLLAEAKRGELRAIGFATVKTDGVTGTGWDGASGTRHLLSSAILMLHFRYASGLLAGKLDKDDA